MKVGLCLLFLNVQISYTLTRIIFVAWILLYFIPIYIGSICQANGNCFFSFSEFSCFCTSCCGTVSNFTAGRKYASTDHVTTFLNQFENTPWNISSWHLVYRGKAEKSVIQLMPEYPQGRVHKMITLHWKINSRNYRRCVEYLIRNTHDFHDM